MLGQGSPIVLRVGWLYSTPLARLRLSVGRRCQAREGFVKTSAVISQGYCAKIHWMQQHVSKFPSNVRIQQYSLWIKANKPLEFSRVYFNHMLPSWTLGRCVFYRWLNCSWVFMEREYRNGDPRSYLNVFQRNKTHTAPQSSVPMALQ